MTYYIVFCKTCKKQRVYHYEEIEDFWYNLYLVEGWSKSVDGMMCKECYEKQMEIVRQSNYYGDTD